MDNKNNTDKLPAGLRRMMLFESRPIMTKDLIDLLVLKRGFHTLDKTKTTRGETYRLRNGEQKYAFNSKAERDYIDHLFESIESIKQVTNVPVQKRELGGPIDQSLGHGAVLDGPDHEHEGIDIKVNGNKVANAEGGELVINKEASETHCEQLSKINQSAGDGIKFDCKKAGKSTNPDATPIMNHGGQLPEMEMFNRILAEEFGSVYDSISELPESESLNADVRTWKVKFKAGLTADRLTEMMENFQLRMFVGPGGVKTGHLEDIQLIPSSDGFLITINKRANINWYFKKGGKVIAMHPISKTTINDPYQINKAIEKLIDQKGENADSYTFEEKNFLRQYSGYGGLSADLLTAAEAKGSFTEYYTPDTIVRKMWALAYKYGFKDGQNICEPAVGTGEFLKYTPVNSIADGYEISKYSYIIAKVLYPQHNFYLQPFENIFIKNRDSIKTKTGDLKKYDLVIGNPPYGDVGGLGMGMGEKQYSKAGNWIEYFILRGLDITKPNGLLIYIIGTEVANGGTPFLQQGPSKIKEMIAERADLIDAYRLPNGVFDRTDVLSDIVVFKRK